LFKEEVLKEIERLNKEYEASVKRVLKNFSTEEKEVKTLSGLPLKPIYTPLDIKDNNFAENYLGIMR